MSSGSRSPSSRRVICGSNWRGTPSFVGEREHRLDLVLVPGGQGAVDLDAQSQRLRRAHVGDEPGEAAGNPRLPVVGLRRVAPCRLTSTMNGSTSSRIRCASAPRSAWPLVLTRTRKPSSAPCGPARRTPGGRAARRRTASGSACPSSRRLLEQAEVLRRGERPALRASCRCSRRSSRGCSGRSAPAAPRTGCSRCQVRARVSANAMCARLPVVLESVCLRRGVFDDARVEQFLQVRAGHPVPASCDRPRIRRPARPAARRRASAPPACPAPARRPRSAPALRPRDCRTTMPSPPTLR